MYVLIYIFILRSITNVLSLIRNRHGADAADTLPVEEVSKIYPLLQSNTSVRAILLNKVYTFQPGQANT